MRNRYLRTAFTFTVVTLTLITLFYPSYNNMIHVMKDVDLRLSRDLQWDRAIEWVKANTPPNAVLMTRKPREWAWFTNRTCVIPSLLETESGNPFKDLDINSLISSIHRFKVNYLIVDFLFFMEYPKLNFLYIDPSAAPFDLVFQDVWYSKNNGKIDAYWTYIYNVTLAKHLPDVGWREDTFMDGWSLHLDVRSSGYNASSDGNVYVIMAKGFGISNQSVSYIKHIPTIHTFLYKYIHIRWKTSSNARAYVELWLGSSAKWSYELGTSTTWTESVLTTTYSGPIDGVALYCYCPDNSTAWETAHYDFVLLSMQSEIS